MAEIKKDRNEPSKKLEILIVDDDRIIHILHSRCVERCQLGFPVSTIEGGQKALEYIESRKSPERHFLVLLDINMPNMNGWEFLEECKKRNIANLLVIMITSSTNTKEKIRMQEYPQIIGSCEKPFSETKMKEIMKLPELQAFTDRF